MIMKRIEEKSPYVWLLLGLVLTFFSYGIFNIRKNGSDTHSGMNVGFEISEDKAGKERNLTIIMA